MHFNRVVSIKSSCHSEYIILKTVGSNTFISYRLHKLQQFHRIGKDFSRHAIESLKQAIVSVEWVVSSRRSTCQIHFTYTFMEFNQIARVMGNVFVHKNRVFVQIGRTTCILHISQLRLAEIFVFKFNTLIAAPLSMSLFCVRVGNKVFYILHHST